MIMVIPGSCVCLNVRYRSSEPNKKPNNFLKERAGNPKKKQARHMFEQTAMQTEKQPYDTQIEQTRPGLWVKPSSRQRTQPSDAPIRTYLVALARFLVRYLRLNSSLPGLFLPVPLQVTPTSRMRDGRGAAFTNRFLRFHR